MRLVAEEDLAGAGDFGFVAGQDGCDADAQGLQQGLPQSCSATLVRPRSTSETNERGTPAAAANWAWVQPRRTR